MNGSKILFFSFRGAKWNQQHSFFICLSLSLSLPTFQGVDECVLSWNTWESLVKLMHFKWMLLHHCHVCHCAHGTAHKFILHSLSNVNIHSRNVSFEFTRSLSLFLSFKKRIYLTSKSGADFKLKNILAQP